MPRSPFRGSQISQVFVPEIAFKWRKTRYNHLSSAVKKHETRGLKGLAEIRQISASD